MVFSLLPLLAIFELDCVIWPICSTYEVEYPCSKKNDEVIDKNKTLVVCYPEVVAVFETLKIEKIKIAVFEYCRQINGTIQLLKLFGLKKYISYMDLYQNEHDDRANFLKMQKELNISFKNMIFFSKFRTSGKLYKDFGFYTVHVDYHSGMTMKLLEDSLKQYERIQRGKIDDR